MKKLLAIALTFTAATAFATEEVSTREFCKGISTLAEVVMTYRQVGTSVVTLMEATSLPLAKLIIKEAYKMPRYSSGEYQRRAISDFRDEFYIQCLKAREK